ncbi:MAG: hypothetical protein J1F32_05955 [Erysipelotrichales bacterium]|nr:hypothetical protein [Erysipelotrichales bacterium]
MKIRIWTLSLLSILLLTSCESESHKKWHISAVEGFDLADEYFPNFFEAIEESLQKNSIQYEKEYDEKIYTLDKDFNANYYISDTIYFNFKFRYRVGLGALSLFIGQFHYKSATVDEVFNLSQCYLNVMIDITDFCAYHFLGTGDIYNSYLNEIKEKHLEDKYVERIPGVSAIWVEEKPKQGVPPYRELSLSIKDNLYDLSLYLTDNLTDINFWDK